MWETWEMQQATLLPRSPRMMGHILQLHHCICCIIKTKILLHHHQKLAATSRVHVIEAHLAKSITALTNSVINPTNLDFEYKFAKGKSKCSTGLIPSGNFKANYKVLLFKGKQSIPLYNNKVCWFFCLWSCLIFIDDPEGQGCREGQ